MPKLFLSSIVLTVLLAGAPLAAQGSPPVPADAGVSLELPPGFAPMREVAADAADADARMRRFETTGADGTTITLVVMRLEAATSEEARRGMVHGMVHGLKFRGLEVLEEIPFTTPAAVGTTVRVRSEDGSPRRDYLRVAASRVQPVMAMLSVRRDGSDPADDPQVRRTVESLEFAAAQDAAPENAVHEGGMPDRDG